MKCAKCGAELKEGCLYCSVCGHEAQIVPDYSVLEDDYLRSLLKEENSGGGSQKIKNQKKKKPEKKQINKTVIAVSCCVLVAAIATIIAVKLYIDNRNANSYEYQMEMGQKEAQDHKFEEALGYYKTALALQPNDINVRLAMAEIYMGQKEYDSAMVLYMEIIQLDSDNEEAYQNLIAIYDEKKDYDSILSLRENVTDEAILELFADYEVDEPVVSPIGGEYDDYITVILYSTQDFPIYYTLDGSDPDEENGILYPEDGIELDEAGNYEIRAVCRNEKGINSEIVTAEYEIVIEPPDYPVVTPDGGTLTGETLVTIRAEKDCSIYYTWDSTDPTELSAKYTEPILVPQGNNVLSVLVVNDKTGLSSRIYRTNFIYYP